MCVSLFEPVGQADDAVFQSCAFDIAHAVERSEFAGGELADAFDHRLDQIGLGRSEAIAGSQFFDPGVHMDREQLVPAWRG